MRRITAVGAGAVAVIEVLGEDSARRLGGSFDRPLPAVGAVVLGRLKDGDEVLDEALVLARSRGSFEVHLHGGDAVVRGALRRLGSAPADNSHGPAERARRMAPFVPSATGARVLLDQASGRFEAGLAQLRAGALEERSALAAAMLERGEVLQRLLRFTVVALTGPVNAGKSTLFNALVGREEALVSVEPGTTRDVLAGRSELQGLPLIILDTAGRREIVPDGGAPHGAALVEQMGIRRGIDAAGRADIVFELAPAPEAPREHDPASTGRAPNEPLLVPLASRADEAFGPDPAAWPPGAIAPAVQPDHAVKIVGQVVRRALLPGRPAGKGVGLDLMGDCVPFEPWMLGDLRAALGETGAAREQALGVLADRLAAEHPVVSGLPDSGG